jgi:competence protein ComEA
MIKKFLVALLSLFAAAAFAAVDVNKATQADLESIKGIGPVIATKILDERKKGSFKTWDDMVTRVKGIGEGNAAKFSADGLTVNGAVFAGAPAASKADTKSAAKAATKADTSKKADAGAAKPAAAKETGVKETSAKDKAAEDKAAKKAEKDAAKAKTADEKAAKKAAGQKGQAASAAATSAASAPAKK